MCVQPARAGACARGGGCPPSQDSLSAWAAALREARQALISAADRPQVLDDVLRRLGALGVEAIERAQRAEQQLLQSQRLAAIGEMTAMMAHEIRNPLAGMSLCLRVLRDHADDPHTQRTCLDDLAEGLRRINDSVSHALDFAKSPPPSTCRCSLAAIVEAARRTTATYVRKSRVVFEIDVPEELPELVADPAQIEQVFVNLILNACKAMPEGGRLTVRARANARHLRAEVVDTGIGMTPEQVQHAFDPFYSAFPEGVGLGLALCRRIVSVHGGALDVASRPGQGSTFRIELPLEPPDAARPAH